MGKTPHYVIYGVDKIMPYELLLQPQQPLYNMDQYHEVQMRVFRDIHNQVRENLEASRGEMIAKANKNLKAPPFLPGDTVMVKEPERKSKLAPRYKGPYVILERKKQKYLLSDDVSKKEKWVHADLLKLGGNLSRPPQPDTVMDTTQTPTTPDLSTNNTLSTNSANPSSNTVMEYKKKLRSAVR